MKKFFGLFASLLVFGACSSTSPLPSQAEVQGFEKVSAWLKDNQGTFKAKNSQGKNLTIRISDRSTKEETRFEIYNSLHKFKGFLNVSNKWIKFKKRKIESCGEGKQSTYKDGKVSYCYAITCGSSASSIASSNVFVSKSTFKKASFAIHVCEDNTVSMSFSHPVKHKSGYIKAYWSDEMKFKVPATDSKEMKDEKQK